MTKLSLSEISKFDHDGMLQRILDLPEQLRDAWELSDSTDSEIDKSKVRNICITGMGGSAIGGDIAAACVRSTQPVPIIVNRHYQLPGFVDEHTLVLACSYSGDTEETLSAFKAAVDTGAQVVCVTSGGQLSERAHQLGLTCFSIPDGSPPRAALGYLTVPILTCLQSLGMMTELTSNLDETVTMLDTLRQELHPERNENLAKKISRTLRNKVPLLYSGSDGMESVAVRWKGQFCENSKVLAFCNFFPELNHNEIMGWGGQALNSHFQVVYLKDHGDHPRIQRRMAITEHILKQKGMSVIEVTSRGESLLTRLFSLIFLGDMISLYLAILNQVDPTAIDNINYLKNELAGS